MQAVSISNALPANAPVPGAALLSSPVAQPTSPFAALFQTQLKGANGMGKLPAPGKPKDSARAPDAATPASNSPLIPWQQLALAALSPVPLALELSTPAAIAAENSTAHQGPPVTSASTPGLSSLPAVSASQNNAVPADSSAAPADLKTQVFLVSPAGPMQGSATSQGPSVAAVSTPSASSLPLVNASPGSANLTAVGKSHVNTNPWDSAVAPVDLQTQTFVVSPAVSPQGGVTSQDSGVAPANSQDPSSDVSVRINQPSTVVIPQAVQNLTSLDVKPVPQGADALPNQSVLPSRPSTETPYMQHIATAPQSGGKAVVPSTVAPSTIAPTTVAPTAASPVYIQVLQAARSGLDFMNLQTARGAQAAAPHSEQIPQSSKTGNAPQLGSQFQIGAAAGVSVASVQTATKTMVIGVPTLSLQNPPQSQAINSTQSSVQSGLDAVATSKPQSKDTSSGSPGNDANTKSDHTLNSAVVHTNGTGFGQSLDTAGTNGGNAQPVPTSSNVVVADIRVPAEPRAASMGPKPGAGSGVPTPQGQSLPATSAADQSIVSGARLTDHPGQTEIRIEMQAGSLGVVELRAHISGDQIGASIAVEHRDAQMMITNDLPSLHTALAEKNLHFNTVSVLQGMGASMGGNSGGDTGQRGFVPSHPKVAYVTQEGISRPVMEAPAESAQAGHANVRLSVRA